LALDEVFGEGRRFGPFDLVVDGELAAGLGDVSYDDFGHEHEVFVVWEMPCDLVSYGEVVGAGEIS
jgi:hypothetical protein